MPELEDNDHAAVGVHLVDDDRPFRHLSVGPDAGCQRVADRLRRNIGGLRDDEAGGRALSVIVGGVIGRDTLDGRAAAGEGRHHDAVLEGERADRGGLQDGTHAVGFLRAPIRVSNAR